MKQLLSIVFLFTSLFAAAQTGDLSGVILDKDYQNEPLPFADVYIKGTTKGTSTDIDGKFLIQDLEIGTKTVVVSFVGYETKEVIVIIESGKTSTIKETLGAGESLEVVVVQGTSAVKESEASLIREQKKADIVIEAIGSEELSKKGIGDAAAAVAKISGISKQESGGNNVYVRGLGDRYLNTTLNGLPLPSNDISKKNIDLNLFSSDVVQNIGVSKTYSSNFYGDFAAGNINIQSKVHSGKPYLNIEVGTNANTRTFDKRFFIHSDSDYFGFGDFFDESPSSVLNRSRVAPDRILDPVGYDLKANGGKKWNFGESSSLSVFGLASFNSKFNYQQGFAADLGTLVNAAFPNSEEYEFNRTTTFMASAEYKINPKHKIGVTSLYINDASDEVGFYGLSGQGINRDAIINTDEGFFITNTQYDQNVIIVNQITGSNKINDKIKLEWGAGLNLVDARQPDRRRNSFENFQLFLDDDPNTNASFFENISFDNQRYFQNIEDTEYNGRFNFNYKVDDNLSFDLGYNHRTKERSFENFRFGTNFLGSNRFEAFNPLNVDAILHPELEGIFFERATFNAGRNPSDAELEIPENTYDGKLSINAFYTNLKYKLGEKWTFLPGLRVELLKQDITYDVINIDPNDPGFREADETLFLPSLNVKYELSEKQNLRFGFSRTISIPEFKEVAPFLYEDVTERIGGNPDLIGQQSFSDILNFDLKYENFFDNGQLFSASLFAKQIKDPVNLVVASDATGAQRFFRTGDNAQIFGLELEGKVNIIAEKLSVGANVSITETTQDLETIDGTIFNASFNRDEDELQGSSPLLINADISYKTEIGKIKSQAVLVYSYFDDRIDALGSSQLENIIEESVSTLDFVLKNQLTEKIGFDISVKNILDPTIARTRENAGDFSTISSFKAGLDLGFKLSYKF